MRILFVVMFLATGLAQDPQTNEIKGDVKVKAEESLKVENAQLKLAILQEKLNSLQAQYEKYMESFKETLGQIHAKYGTSMDTHDLDLDAYILRRKKNVPAPAPASAR